MLRFAAEPAEIRAARHGPARVRAGREFRLLTEEIHPAGEAPANPIPETTLAELPAPLQAAAAAAGWTSLMPVQARGIPCLLAGRDMIVQARTGSGKTGAFLLPMLERLDPKALRCQALILVPTRELAGQ